MSTVNPHGPPPEGTSPLPVFISASTTATLVGDATLRIYYTKEDLSTADVDKDTLRIFRWDETELRWEPLQTTHGSDERGDYVEVKVTGFSDFAPMGSSGNPVGGYVGPVDKLSVIAPCLALAALVAAAALTILTASRTRRQ